MTLDISTLVLLTIAIGFGLGVLSVVFSHLQPGVRGAGLWGAAMLAFGAGYALLYFYASTRHVALLYAGWIGVLCAILMMVRALNRICGIKGPGTILDVSVIGIALIGWIFFTFTYPSPLGHANTILILVSIVVARAAWDTWSNVRGSRIAAPAAAVAVLLGAVAATSILEALPPVTGSELPSEFGSPALVLVWAVSLAFLTVCVLWLEVSQLYATMETAGMVDVVTGLSNRLTIIAEIEVEHSRSHRARTPFSIAIFGMDNFENVIDEHGQRAGDQMLKWAAGVIRENVRPYDKVGRYGPDEFLLMMPMTTEKESLGIAERSRQAIQKQACVVDGRQLGATVSVGVAVGERGADLDAVLHAADEAISRAKDQGRNCTVVAPLIGMVAEVGIVAEGQGANA